MTESFESLGISAFFKARLLERDISVPTKIQKLVIPKLSAGENVLFSSATGTGKTFAYMLPLFENFVFSDGDSYPDILILTPTLELCSQIKREADFLLNGAPCPKKINAALIIGSAAMNRQIDVLKKDKPKIIVGNPARLLQLARMGKLKLNKLKALVLDEGDKLVSDELLGDTEELLKKVNTKRQTAVCSATMSSKNKERVFPFMGETISVLETSEQEILRERIRHLAFFSESRRKISTLCSFLKAVNAKKALVFTKQGGQVGNIVSQLQYRGFAASGLNGDMDKKSRKQSFDDFRAGRTRILVSTDLAARGLDILTISHVVSLDVPDDGEAYIHRAGRTARAGRRGVMATIGDAEELERFAKLEKKMGIVVYPKILYKGKICDPELNENETNYSLHR